MSATLDLLQHLLRHLAHVLGLALRHLLLHAREIVMSETPLGILK
jgi:hypothetical protein